MNTLNFLTTPRAFGNPKQSMDKNGNPVVHSHSTLIKLINKNNGINDVFVSNNRFLSFINRKPFQISMNKIFLDFDSKLKGKSPSDALMEVRIVMKYFNELNLPYLINFSGSKGFHIFIPIQEKKYTTGKYLTDIVRAIMLHIRHKFDLKTIDPTVANPTKLCRVPYTIHPKTGLKCTPLNNNWVRDWDIDRIMKYAKNPNGWKCDLIKGKKYLDFESLIKYMDINIEEEIEVGRSQFALESDSLKFLEPADEFLAELLHYPCLINAILGVKNAVHYARFMATLQLKRLGYSPAWIFHFFKQRQYMDVEFENSCRYQINNIYNSEYIFPCCNRIREEGLCIGKTCKYFK